MARNHRGEFRRSGGEEKHPKFGRKGDVVAVMLSEAQQERWAKAGAAHAEYTAAMDALLAALNTPGQAAAQARLDAARGLWVGLTNECRVLDAAERLLSRPAAVAA